MRRKAFLIAALLVSAMPTLAITTSGNGMNIDKKVIEISKIVKLTATQEAALRRAYDAYSATLDSSVYFIKDAIEAARIKYKAGKTFNAALMNILTESQANRYIRTTSTPEIEAKTDYKLSLLKERGDYSEAEIEKKRQEIFNYLMSEKIVYVRDKYDIRKQKDNIRRLKAVQPASLIESETIEKQKAQGRIINGKIKW